MNGRGSARRHGLGGLGCEEHGEARRIVRLLELVCDRLQARGGVSGRAGQRLHDKAPPLLEFERHREPSPVLRLEFVMEDREVVAPRLDGEVVAAETVERQVGRPAVVAEGRHGTLAPGGLVGSPPFQRDRDEVVALAEHVGLDPHDLADDPLHGVAAPVDRRRHRLDREAGRRDRGSGV